LPRDTGIVLHCRVPEFRPNNREDVLISVVQTISSIEVANIKITALGRVCVNFIPSDILTTDFATHTESQPTADFS
jgi:hypothetical protein